MPAGKHLEGYRRPKTGEPRRYRQPTAIEKLPGEQRDQVRAFVDDARNGRCRCQKHSSHRHDWDGLAEAANREFKLKLGSEAYRRDYDVFVEQVRQENLDRNRSARELAEAFAARGIEGLPAAAMNALTGESLAALNAKDPAERQAAMLSFGVVLAKLIDAQSKQKRAEIEERKVNLAQKKFEDLKAKAEKELNAIGAKIGKGKEATVEDINRIRRKVFGLGPAAN